MPVVNEVAKEGLNSMKGTMKGKSGIQLCGDDWCDRLNNRVTLKIIVALFVLSFYKEYVGKGQPIQCWIPAEFKKSWEKYSENYCYVEGTYPVSFNEKFPEDMNERRNRTLDYYQWVPYILIVMYGLFKLPRVVWNLLGYADMPTMCTGLVNARCCEYIAAKGDGEESALRNGDELTGFRHCRITVYYMLFKVANLLNCVVQLLSLNLFLNSSYGAFYGYGILRDLIIGRRWTESDHFPRVTFCDTPVRDVADIVHIHTFQCVLPLNMFNEKIFVFIWWWLAVLTVLNVVNICEWLIYIFYPAKTRNFIRTNLSFRDVSLTQKKGMASLVDTFADTMFTVDTVTALRLMEENNERECPDVISDMFKEWVKTAESAGDGSAAGDTSMAESIVNESVGQHQRSIEEDYVEYDPYSSHFNTMSTRFNTMSTRFNTMSSGNPYF